jgi:hypothetical protein
MIPSQPSGIFPLFKIYLSLVLKSEILNGVLLYMDKFFT